jgi:hypothetical protein
MLIQRRHSKWPVILKCRETEICFYLISTITFLPHTETHTTIPVALHLANLTITLSSLVLLTSKNSNRKYQ